MNRHARRSDMRILRRAELVTHCRPADDVAIQQNKMLRDAARNYRLPHGSHKPVCISCKRSFLFDGAQVGLFLFAMPVGVAGLCTTSAFCVDCAETLSSDEVDRIATRILRTVAPGGRFIDGR
jgi:hypothetical protein